MINYKKIGVFKWKIKQILIQQIIFAKVQKFSTKIQKNKTFS